MRRLTSQYDTMNAAAFALVGGSAEPATSPWTLATTERKETGA